MIGLLALLLAAPAHARPTEGGQFGYDSTDEVVSWDAPGGIRVHYAVSGPSTALLDDEDDNGVPDFVEEVAFHVLASLDTFEAAGFRRPLSEADVGLGPLGGSEAFDVYLVDFGGGSDGAFRVDGCSGGVCAGHLLIENDFRGYSYGSTDEAARTLASHELFHAVQAAYAQDLPVWVSEGTAVWAQRLYDPESDDFIRFAKAYISDTGRSLDKPPAGPVPEFAYATGLWFDFLTLRHDDDVIIELLLGLGEAPDADPLDVMGDSLADRGDTWRDAFSTFVTWNLATFIRAGGLTDGGYPYADRLTSPGLESISPRYDDDDRVFPLAAVYFAIDHPGGPLYGGSAECEDDGLPTLIVFPAVGDDGLLRDALDVVDGGGRVLVDGSDLPEGRYYAALTVPEPADSSQTDRVCLGGVDALDEGCMCADSGEPEPEAEPEPGGCGCQALPAHPAATFAPVLLLLGLVGCRRRDRRRA